MLLNVPYGWQIVISVACNILASSIFIFLLLYLGRPKFKISTFICSTKETLEIYNNGNGSVQRYMMKIVNLSRFHAFDTEVELRLLKPENAIGHHQNLKIQSLKWRAANMKHITRYRKDFSKADPFALFANLIHTNEPLQEYLNDPESYLELKVTVRHGLTGLASTFIQTFPDPECIKQNHKFEFGCKIGTIPANKAI